MNNKSLLVKCITLLFRESQITGQQENSASLVREIISDIQLAELHIGVDRERDVLDGLRSIALAMCDMPVDHEYDLTELLQRLRVVCLEEDSLYDTLLEGMAPELNEVFLKRNCINHKKALSNFVKEKHINKIVNEASFSLKFQRSKIDNIKKFIAELVGKLEPYQVETGEKDPAVIDDVDMNNEFAVTKVFGAIKDLNDGTTVMKTGFQGLNRMLDGGFRRGEEVVIGALQHNFKTGFSLTLFEHIALFNVPVMIDPKKKPLLLRISFEDGLTLNFQYLYQNLMENETGIVPDVTTITNEEMARYVKEKLSVNGYTTRFMHVNPSMWTYRDICNKILELEADGYEIHLCMVDYLLKLPTTGCDQGPAGHDIRNMYERIKNFMMARGICVITPHQLSTDAKMLMRAGEENLVRNIVGGGYYAGSKQIDQVVDLEIFIHIVEVNNQSWLTIQRGKHRKIKQTPKEYQYMALPFSASGLLYDVGKADTTRKKVGGGPIGSGAETPFWAADDAVL